jgi:ABC-2 type transport system ATP-binding protein
MIELVHVSRNYGKKLAVADLSLAVPPGQLFAFLGPNGAGKTTTIKMMVGLLRPSAGTVRVCGYDVVAQPRHANQLLGYVPDQPYVYEKLSGREFLQFVADMHGLSKHETAGRIDREIRHFDLGGFVDDLAENYSHGMKQRLAFAAALLHDPAVLIVDEPMVGLDPRSVRLVKDLLRRKAREGTTVFMSTHSLSMAEEIRDRLGIVEQGRLRFLGTLAELRNQLAIEHMSLEDLYLEITARAEKESVAGGTVAADGAPTAGGAADAAKSGASAGRSEAS